MLYVKFLVILALTCLLSGCKVFSQFEVHRHFHNDHTHATLNFGFEAPVRGSIRLDKVLSSPPCRPTRGTGQPNQAGPSEIAGISKITKTKLHNGPRNRKPARPNLHVNSFEINRKYLPKGVKGRRGSVKIPEFPSSTSSSK